jgi:hypothetical protein
MNKSSSLGMPMHPKKYSRGTSVKAWGCPRGTPSSSAKIRSRFNTLYFYCFMHYEFFLERQLFLVFIFVLFCLLQQMVGPQQIPFGEIALLFIC